MKQSIIPICHLNNISFQFFGLSLFPRFAFPSVTLSSCVYSSRAFNIFLRFQTGAEAFKMVFYTRCKQELWSLLFFKKTKQNKNKIKTEKKLKEMFLLITIKYPKRGYKIQKKKKKEERKKKQRNQEKKTVFCLFPPGDAIKLNLNNSNAKVPSPISNYLVTSGGTILFVFRLRLFLHLLFLNPSMTRAQFFNTHFLFFVSYFIVFKRCANYNQLPKYSETLRRKISPFKAFRYQSADKKLVDCALPSLLSFFNSWGRASVPRVIAGTEICK